MERLSRLVGIALLLVVMLPVLASSQVYMKKRANESGLRFFECSWIDWWTVGNCGDTAYMERYGASPQATLPVDAVGNEKNLVDAGELGTVQVDDKGRSMPMLDELADSRRVRVQQYWRLNNLPSVRSQAPPRRPIPAAVS